MKGAIPLIVSLMHGDKFGKFFHLNSTMGFAHMLRCCYRSGWVQLSGRAVS
jgi:hypothetical protein